MKPFQALQQVVKPALEDAFGTVVAANILMVAKNKAAAPAVGLELEDYFRVINEIVRDERVRQMWGELGARDRLVKWKKAVDSEE